ncbi:MAG TPA: hypothetical protein VK171_12295 [Fimbriimonas sp.]|nr:hypothetical protein [Fimbriimonas sp.]
MFYALSWILNLQFLFETYNSPLPAQGGYIGGHVAILIGGVLMLIGLGYLYRKVPADSGRDAFGFLGGLYPPFLLLSYASGEIVKQVRSPFTWGLSLAMMILTGWLLISVFTSMRRFMKQEPAQ